MTQRRRLLHLALTATLARGAGAATDKANNEDKTLLFPIYSNSAQTIRIRRILETAYASLGYQVVTEEMTTERGLLEADRGTAAGDMYRTRLVEKEAPNLVRVPVLLDNFVITTMTKAASLAAPTLEQAAGMHVGIRRGMRNVESLTAGWPNVERAVETFAMLKMLNTGNIDVIIGYPENLRYTLEQVGLSPDLYSFKEVHRDPAYHYLNKRHAALVPALTAEFNNIKGKYDSVVEGFMARGNK